MVEKAIQERTKKAKSLCMAYQFICDYLKLSDSGNILQVKYSSEPKRLTCISALFHCHIKRYSSTSYKLRFIQDYDMIFSVNVLKCLN